MQALDQEEAEFASLVKELSSEVFPSDYVDFDVEVATSQIPVDVESIAWRREFRQEAIKLIMGSKNSQGNEDSMVDMGSITWRQEYRQEAIKLNMRSKNSHENNDPMEIVRDDDFEEIINPMAVKLISNALQIVNV